MNTDILNQKIGRFQSAFGDIERAAEALDAALTSGDADRIRVAQLRMAATLQTQRRCLEQSACLPGRAECK